ncbi:hypothetical protein FLAV_02870 [Flavobacteriales bacterium]|nr:hypothetical protein FLAV_02870 [Flavobacteriales bacterium]
MKKIIKFLSVTTAVVCTFAFTGNKNENILLKPSETGYQAVDCEPEINGPLGWKCTSTLNGGCTSSKSKCKPYTINPGGPTSDLNMFGLDYDALRRHLIDNWGWPASQIDNLINELRQ